MKLYATIESERATKGQGGNEFIFSKFSVEREKVGEVELELLKDGEWLLKYRPNELTDWEILRQGSVDILETRQKGKRQKSETARQLMEKSAKDLGIIES
jgi:hypothetical protein